jgi:ribosomal protein L21E
MKKQPLSALSFALTIVIAGLLFSLLAVGPAIAQEGNYKAGDRVEVDVNMSSSPENIRWQKATIVEVMMWQWRISGIYVKTDEGRTLTVGVKHLRPLNEPVTRPAATTSAGGKARNERPGPDGTQQAEFKVGDRVEVDSIMARDPKQSSWIKATVTAVDLKNQRYIVMRDNLMEMSILIRPEHVWIRHLNDGSKTPEFPTCEFYKNYPKVSNTAAPSAALFKAVIFDRYNSVNRYYDFGLVFEDFKMGAAYKNRARGQGRKDVDPAPIGATIYPLKAKLITCEKDLNSTFRTEWTNEFSCYKSRFGEWVCNNSAPQNYKRSVPIPNK